MSEDTIMNDFELKTQGYIFRIYKVAHWKYNNCYAYESLGPAPDNRIILFGRAPEYVKESIAAALDLWASSDGKYADMTIDEFLAKILPD